MGAQHVQVQIAVVDQTLTVPLPGGSAPQRGLLDVGIHGHREKQLTLGKADHRLVTTHQLHGIDSGGHNRDVRGHDCDPDTSPAMSGEKRIGPGLAFGREGEPDPGLTHGHVRSSKAVPVAPHRCDDACMWLTVILMAVVAAVDPMRVAALVVILARRQPVRHLVAYLIGGFGVSLIVGAVVLFALEGVGVGGGSGIPAEIEIAVGVLALLVAALVGSGIADKLRSRRRSGRPALPAAVAREPPQGSPRQSADLTRTPGPRCSRCSAWWGQARPGSAGRWPPRASMARAMSAPAEWKPNAMRVNSRILVFVDSISPLRPAVFVAGARAAVRDKGRSRRSLRGRPRGARMTPTSSEAPACARAADARKRLVAIRIRARGCVDWRQFTAIEGPNLSPVDLEHAVAPDRGWAH